MESELNRLDKIHIQELLLRCIIGTNPDERVKKQDVTIDITMFGDLKAACRSDNLADTVNYKAVKQKIVAMVEASSFMLIEKLAEEIAGICLAEPLVAAVRVTVRKPGALRYAANVGIEILRKKQ